MKVSKMKKRMPGAFLAASMLVNKAGFQP